MISALEVLVIHFQQASDKKNSVGTQMNPQPTRILPQCRLVGRHGALMLSHAVSCMVQTAGRRVPLVLE